jgi:hypothetical protein
MDLRLLPVYSVHSMGVNLRPAFLCTRPEAVREIRKTSSQDGLFKETHHSNDRLH